MHLQARIVKAMGDNVTGYFQNYFPRAIWSTSEKLRS